jgi:predicted alpha-1,2-mannosidase
MLDHYRHYTRKKLPIWSFHANETDCMIGYHSVPVIADAYLKGIRGYDTTMAMQALIETANNPLYDGLDLYKQYGYVPIDLEKEAASKTLEYAFDDWAIAQMAARMGKSNVYDTFFRRSQFYKNIFDTKTGFMRARLSDGGFREPFDPAVDKFAGGDFTEANAWRYSWFVPHDIEGLVNLHGSQKAFRKKLDEFFTLKPEGGALYYGKPAIIGEYEHANEPVHHVAYLYNYCGAPEKTQEMVYRIMTDQYKATPDGLIGNDDCGQMSAWYIFSAMGFYPTNPVGGRYDIGLPLVDEAVIHLENGQTFRIVVENRKNMGQRIKSVHLNGALVREHHLLHADIMRGGEMRFVLR